MLTVSEADAQTVGMERRHSDAWEPRGVSSDVQDARNRVRRGEPAAQNAARSDVIRIARANTFSVACGLTGQITPDRSDEEHLGHAAPMIPPI